MISYNKRIDGSRNSSSTDYEEILNDWQSVLTKVCIVTSLEIAVSRSSLAEAKAAASPPAPTLSSCWEAAETKSSCFSTSAFISESKLSRENNSQLNIFCKFCNAVVVKKIGAPNLKAKIRYHI